MGALGCERGSSQESPPHLHSTFNGDGPACSWVIGSSFDPSWSLMVKTWGSSFYCREVGGSFPLLPGEGKWIQRSVLGWEVHSTPNRFSTLSFAPGTMALQSLSASWCCRHDDTECAPKWNSQSFSKSLHSLSHKEVSLCVLEAWLARYHLTRTQVWSLFWRSLLTSPYLKFLSSVHPPTASLEPFKPFPQVRLSVSCPKEFCYTADLLTCFLHWNI